jgi:hypothetical protein
MSYHYTNSRTIPNADSSFEKYSTICVFVDSLNAVHADNNRPLNSAFTINLNQPIILDITQRYVCSLIKATFDNSTFGAEPVNIDILCDFIEPQYVNSSKSMSLLNRIYKVSYNAGFYQTSTPFEYQAVNPINKFINNSTKVISSMTFLINLINRLGSSEPLPQGLYPTQLCIIIKQVPPHVVSTTLI